MNAGPEPLAALAPVVDVLDRLGVAYQVGGSVASSAYGAARSTMDVDLAADLDDRHVDALVSALQGAYYVDAGAIREALRDRSSFNLIHHPTMMKVDIFIPKRRAYDLEAMRRSRSDTLGDEPGARAFQVASPEDVVLQKLEWFHIGGRTSERQWADVLGVLRVQGSALDMDYLRRWAPELQVADLLDRAVAAA